MLEMYFVNIYIFLLCSIKLQCVAVVAYEYSVMDNDIKLRC